MVNVLEKETEPMSRSRFHLHGQTELFEAANEPPGNLGFVAPFEMIGAEFVVRRFVFEDVVLGE